MKSSTVPFGRQSPLNPHISPGTQGWVLGNEVYVCISLRADGSLHVHTCCRWLHVCRLNKRQLMQITHVTNSGENDSATHRVLMRCSAAVLAETNEARPGWSCGRRKTSSWALCEVTRRAPLSLGMRCARKN